MSSSKINLTIGRSVFWGRSTSLRFKINNYAGIVASHELPSHTTTQRNVIGNVFVSYINRVGCCLCHMQNILSRAELREAASTYRAAAAYSPYISITIWRHLL